MSTEQPEVGAPKSRFNGLAAFAGLTVTVVLGAAVGANLMFDRVVSRPMFGQPDGGTQLLRAPCGLPLPLPHLWPLLPRAMFRSPARLSPLPQKAAFPRATMARWSAWARWFSWRPVSTHPGTLATA